MLNITSKRRISKKNIELNIAPLIDMIFILLIFFLVTTSFVKETGVDINRPVASSASSKNKANILIGITRDNRIFMDRREIDIRTVRANVERAISNLKNKDLVSLDRLVSLSVEELAGIIRPAGYYNIKAKRLKNLINFIFDQYDGDLEGFLQEETDRLREGLLSVNGVGPETADSIILYAAKRPLFVIDAYTHRILSRHAMAGEDATYYDLQGLFMDHLPEDSALFNEFHALIVQAGKNYCRKNPICEDCPLNQLDR
jgi:endonuclease-3 related protein